MTTPLYLRTLGGLALENGGRPIVGAASQRGRLAILSVIALAGDLGVSRDRLLAFFWPDSDTDRARGALKQALYALRRDVGERDLTLGTSTLRLNADVIRSDVGEFESAVKAGDLESAARLYSGPFLDGVHVSAAVEWEQWIDGQRERLARGYAQTIETLARQDAARGDHAAAVEWWQRLVALDPLNTRTSVGLIEALAAAGDRAGALAHASRHEALLRSELGIPADPALTGLVLTLRSSVPAAPMVPRQEASPDIRHPKIELSSGERVVEMSVRRGPRWAWFAVAAALLCTVVVGAWAATRHAEPALDDDLVAVMPFRVASTRPELASLGSDLVTLFWMKLTGDVGPRAVDLTTVQAYRRRVVGSDTAAPNLGQAVQAARLLGAGRLIVGAVSGVESHIELTAYLYDVPSGRVRAHYTIAGRADSVAALVDAMATGLVAGAYGLDADRLPQLARYHPAAVREYLAGLRAMVQGMSIRQEAQDHFRNAVREDSTFVLAGLSSYDIDENSPEMARWTWARRDGLSTRDRLLLRALAGHYVVPGWAETDQVRALEDLVARYPEWSTARWELANIYLMLGPFAGVANWEGRARSMYEELLQESPSNARMAEEALEATAAVEDTEGVRRVVALSQAVHAAPADAWFMKWRAARFLGDQRSLARIWSVLDTLHDGEWKGALYGMAEVAQVDGRGLGDAERAVARLDALGEPNSDAALVSLAGGHYRQWVARRHEEYGWDDPLEAAVGVVRDALYFTGPVDGELAKALRYLAKASVGGNRSSPVEDRAAEARCWLAQWRLAQGDSTGTEAAIGQLRRAPLPQQFALCGALLELELAERRGDDARAAALRMDSTSRAIPFGLPGGPYDLVLARAFIHLRDPHRALAAARRRCHQLFCNGELWPAQILAEGRAAALLGDKPAALSAYDQYLRLREHADGAWRAEADSARAERAELAASSPS